MIPVRVRKHASLVAVCLQSTILALVLNVSSHSKSSQQHYKSSSAVIVTEIVKLGLSIVLASLQCQPQGVPEAEPVPQAREQPCDRRDSKTTGIDSRIDSPSATSPYRRQSTFSYQQSERRAMLDSTAQEMLKESKASATHVTMQQVTHETPNTWQACSSGLGLVWEQVFAKDLHKMAIPAILFSLQNMLIYVAARNLSVVMFQITSQLKSLITALCAVLMLGRRYTPAQWLSLLILGMGVACIQLAPQLDRQKDYGAERPVSAAEASGSQLTGLLAVIISCFASAIAATYFELVLKQAPPPTSQQNADLSKPTPRQVPMGRLSIQLEARMSQLGSSKLSVTDAFEQIGGRRHTVAFPEITQPIADHTNEESARSQHVSLARPSVWIKNVQLAFFSLICTIAYNFVSTGSSFATFTGGFFDGFDGFTWAVIVIQAVGGLLTALVIKHADNVAKGFALSMSIVLTLAISVVYFGQGLSLITVVGGLMVVVTSFTFERFGRRVG